MSIPQSISYPAQLQQQQQHTNIPSPGSFFPLTTNNASPAFSQFLNPTQSNTPGFIPFPYGQNVNTPSGLRSVIYGGPGSVGSGLGGVGGVGGVGGMGGTNASAGDVSSLSLDAAVRGLDEALQLIERVEGALERLKMEQENLFGSPSRAGIAGQEGQGQGDIDMDGAQQNQQVEGGEDGARMSRLSATYMEYTQLLAILQSQLSTNTLGALPLYSSTSSRPSSSTLTEPTPQHAQESTLNSQGPQAVQSGGPEHFINSDTPLVPLPNPDLDFQKHDDNQNQQSVITTAGSIPQPSPSQHAPKSSSPRTAPLDMPTLVAWAENRAALEFSRREGTRNGARVVLDALKAR